MSQIEGFDAGDFSTRIAGEIKNFSGDGYIDKKSERRLDAVLKYAIVAGKKVSMLCCSIACVGPRIFQFDPGLDRGLLADLHPALDPDLLLLPQSEL